MAGRVTPIAQEFELLVRDAWSPEAQAGYVRDFAREQIASAERQNEKALGYKPEHQLYVDGTERNDLSAVTGNSRILVEFEILFDVIARVDEMLRAASPRGTRTKLPGQRYVESHHWFADDREFTDIANPPKAEQYIVLNSQPYTRRLERGWSKQSPQGVYQVVATMAKRQFGNIAYVGFTYRSFPHGAIGAWSGSASARKMAREVRGGRASLHEEWLTRQPCIIIDPGRG